MKSLSAFNRPRTVGDLLNTIAESLDRDGWEIEPGSVDTQGLSLSVEGVSYRLSFTDESRLYPTQEAYDRAEYAAFIRSEDKRRNMEEDGNDMRDAFIGEVDPCGFNGMEISE